MKKIFKATALVLAATIAACGGGGGSSGDTQESYSITLRADKTQLPLNIQNVGAGQGVYAPFTTSLYVEARKGSSPIPGGENIFGCNVSGGLDSGSLYYLDGNSEHEKEIDDGNGGKITVPLAYRSITLGANAGGSSFHFHTGNQAGIARVTCSVTDPRDKRVYSASVDITVGGATGRAASIQAIAAYPVLGTQGNSNNLRTSTAIEAHVLDDANQPVAAPAKANLLVAIVSGGAASGARLLAGSQSGSELQVSTTGGVGLFSLASGPAAGSILLEMTADRFDNDVSNGIQDRVVSLYVVSAHDSLAMMPLVISGEAAIVINRSVPFAYALFADGGVSPYKWSFVGSLPSGLTLSESGVINGTTGAAEGNYGVVMRVTDGSGASVIRNMTLTVKAP